jgi:hypothetical protein
LSCVGGDRLETGVGAVGERLARSGEGRLCHRMVLRGKDKLDRVARLGRYGVRVEGECAGTDCNLEVGGGRRGGGGDGNKSGGESEMHL